jgi:hypothetical protein
MLGDVPGRRRGLVRRAKLYYLRNVDRQGARIRERKVVRRPKGRATQARSAARRAAAAAPRRRDARAAKRPPAAPGPAGGGLRWSEIRAPRCKQAHGPLLARLDESDGASRGPVVVCALVMPPDAPEVPGVDDSTRLSPPRGPGPTPLCAPPPSPGPSARLSAREVRRAPTCKGDRARHAARPRPPRAGLGRSPDTCSWTASRCACSACPTRPW